jgi:general secretion pathway protein D
MERVFMRALKRCAVLLSSAALLAAEPLRLAAQEAAAPTTQPAPATAPSSQPSVTITLPPRTDGLALQSGNHVPTTQISFNFKDASVDAILDYLSQTAGFVVVKEQPITGRVTVLSKQPVTPEEAVTLLQSVLKVNGFTIIQMGRVLDITTRDKAKKGNIPVRFGADPEQIPATDELITQVIPVRSVDAVKLKQDLQPLIGTDADLSANGGSNTVIMTDTSANIRRIVEIISNLDKRDSLENTIIVKQLKYADATAAAKLVTDIFKPPDQSNGQNANVPPQVAFFRALRGGGRGGGGGGGGGGADESDKGQTGKVLASADQRTNTVVVTGPADTLKVIQNVLEQLDANPAAEQTFFLYSLKNGQAIDMASTLNSLFSGTPGTSTNSSGANTANRLSSSSSSGFGGSGSSGRSGSSSSGFGGSSGGFGSSGSGGSSSSGFGSTPISRGPAGGTGVSSAAGGARPGGAGAAGINGSAASELIGQVLVVADADTNSLLVATATKYEQKVRDIILQLDRPVPQVLVKVLIAEVTHDNSLDAGVDWSILNQRASGQGLKLVNNNGNAAATGGLSVSLLENNLTATLHALATEGKVDVLSRPYILTSDNQQAQIVIGSEVPIITNSQLTDTGQQINTVQYRDIGIILNVTPHINPDGLVICDVSPEVSNTTDQSVPIASNVSAPVFSLRSADTRVGIRDGTTIVIGGLMQDQKTQTVSKIPILGSLPGIGVFFQRNQVTKTKTELLFFITPHVAMMPERLQPMSQDEMKGTYLTPRAVQPGVFEEQMHGMQRGEATTKPSPFGASSNPPDAQSTPRTVSP